MPRFDANLNWLFTELPFLRRFEAAARASFAAVELASPYGYSHRSLRKAVDDVGLTVVLINTPAASDSAGSAGLACVAGRQEEFRDGVERALEYAAALDCRLVHMMAGVTPIDLDRDRISQIYLENVRWAAEVARSTPVKLTIEAINGRDVPGFFLQTQEQALSIVQAVGRDRVGVQFDVYHCQVAQGDVTRRLETCLPFIDHIQIADPPSRHEPGTGEIAWPYVFRRMDELGYAGWVGCEYRPTRSTTASLKWRDEQSHPDQAYPAQSVVHFDPRSPLPPSR